MRAYRLVVTILLTCAALHVPGRTAAQRLSLTLEEAIERAQTDNFKVRAAGGQVTAAEKGVTLARASLFPKLAIQGTHATYDGVVFYNSFLAPGQPPGAGTDVGDSDASRLLLARLNQVLYAGGGIRAQIRGSKVEAEIARRDLTRQRVELSYEVTQAYYQERMADKSLEVARAIVERSVQHLDTVQSLAAEEEALRVDVLAAEARLAVDQQALLRAENDLRFAQLGLKRLLATDPEAELNVTDSLDLPEQEVNEEEWLDTVLAHSPEIQKAELQLDLAQQAIAGARSHFKPKLELEGFYSDVDNETLFDGAYTGALLKISIPFAYDAVAGSGATGQARARKAQQQEIVKEITSLIRLAVQQAVGRLNEAYQSVGVARQNLDFFQERYRVTQRTFDESLATFAEVLDHHAALSEAELDLYGAQFQARLAEAELKRLSGDFSP